MSATKEIDLEGSSQVSFRDPAGRVVVTHGRVFRIIDETHQATLLPLLESSFHRELVSSGQLVHTQILQEVSLVSQLIERIMPASHNAVVLEHTFIGFPTYAYEWAPEMLYRAAELTLDIMEELLAHGDGLKDASPYNVLFNGPRPIFIDLASIERREPCDPTWRAYAQFVRTFILPLLADSYFGIGLDQTFRVHRDGLDSEHIYRMSSIGQRLRPPFLTLASLPSWLSRLNPDRYEQIYQARRSGSKDQASFILRGQLRALRKKLAAVQPKRSRPSIWKNYEDKEQQREHHLPLKEKFVASALGESKATSVLDVGCNRGFFSLLAARAGCSVVAIDQDPVVVGAVWKEAYSQNLNILPMVIDLTRPTPALGWRNRETLSFLERASGSFDCVMMLAVVHHMLVTERIPLEEIFRLAAELTTNLLLIEFVSPSDRMFRLLTRGNEDLYSGLTRDVFEETAKKYFSLERIERLGDSQRWLYQMRRSSAIV